MRERRREALIPFLTLTNWAKAAAKCGFDVEPIFREIGIPTDLVHLETATVRREAVEAAMKACTARARTHHFPFVLGEAFTFDYLPDLEIFLSTSATLRSALRVFDWVRLLIQPELDARLHERGNQARLVLTLGDSVESATMRGFIEALLTATYKFACALLRSEPGFAQLKLRRRRPRHAEDLERFFGKVCFAQAEDSLMIPRELMDLPLLGASPVMHRQAEYRIEQRMRAMPKVSDVAEDLERVFVAQPALLQQNVARTARALGLSARTLQRRLRAVGWTFAEMQTRSRFGMAADLLRDTRLDLETISERLGFGDRRSFTRAFTRWSGASPSAFRNASAQR